jgi:hypothetical protein
MKELCSHNIFRGRLLETCGSLALAEGHPFQNTQRRQVWQFAGFLMSWERFETTSKPIDKGSMISC